MAKLSILVVEDDALARTIMEGRLEGHAVEFATTKDSALKAIAGGDFDLCFVDLNLGKDDNCSGLDVIPEAVAKGSYVVVMSGHDSERFVEKAYELGCNDFYAKGNEESNVAQVLDRFQAKREKAETERLFAERFVTEDPATRATITQALKFAASELPIMLLGPSGTGKTSLARIIHDYSGRQGEFIAINCAAYSEELLEAELFGYRKGAFTGAHEHRKGKLALADGGTLFLDEIGSMSLKMQAKLLKAIEEKSFYPLGSEKPETSQFRVISATLEDIQKLVKTSGKMRFDFYQRIHGFAVTLRPLAERSCDVFPLISLFTRSGKRLAFAPDAKAAILKHDWPGNIRELRKFVELLLASDEGRVSAETVAGLLRTMRVDEAAGSFITDDQLRYALAQGLDEAVNRFVDTIVKQVLDRNGGIKTKTLNDLKISTRLLYRSIARFAEPAKEEVAA